LKLISDCPGLFVLIVVVVVAFLTVIFWALGAVYLEVPTVVVLITVVVVFLAA
jgi:hypothetical protein